MRTRHLELPVSALLAVALVVGCEETPTTPEPAVKSTTLGAAKAAKIEHQVIRIPVENEVFFLPCVGEPISFDGFVQFVIHTGSNQGVPDPLIQHLVSHPLEKLKGVGLTTGAEYKLNSSIAIAIQSPDDVEEFPLTHNEGASTVLIRPGDGVVWHAKVKIRVVINANGDVHVDHFEITSECP